MTKVTDFIAAAVKLCLRVFGTTNVFHKPFSELTISARCSMDRYLCVYVQDQGDHWPSIRGLMMVGIRIAGDY